MEKMGEQVTHGKLLVCAIDFGTTFSGYAFQLTADFLKEPTKNIHTNQVWNAGVAALMSLKTPTCLLLDKEKEFVAFGYEAETQYSDLALDDLHHDYLFFRRFKMLLHRNPGLNRDTKLAASNGVEIPAKAIFGHGINFLKNHALENFRRCGTEVEDSEVQWVITVPAIWTDAAKQFMREAAQKADIFNDQLIIALEPEAASLLCRYTSDASGNELFKPGSKYMVIDLGGGTADITIHQVADDGTLKELHSASGGAWGGIKVDQAFEQLLIDIVEEDVFAEFQKKNACDHFDMGRDFEVKKRTFNDKMKHAVIKLPSSLMEHYKTMKGRSIKEAIEASMYADRVAQTADKLKMDPDLLKGLFRDPLEHLVEHIREILNQPVAVDTNILLLVGGFSESPIVQETIKTRFPNHKVIVPQDAGLAVLKGAVLYGHRPKLISVRVNQVTYGIAISRLFKTGDPEELKFTSGSAVLCRDVFHKFVEKGQPIKEDDEHSMPFSAKGQNNRVRVYSSNSNNPKYVTDDGCRLIGEMMINISSEITSGNNIQVKIEFGGTELVVEGMEKNTGEVFRARFDFLSDK
ncbi:heat shock 70 kDa protein 12A-like [Mytilus trossulus]|uniref:heat shock 70 kDa protein 12A-like n=1 Tax=Mytilus trossulus TaxID=6551 RepID=UPI00300515F9